MYGPKEIKLENKRWTFLECQPPTPTLRRKCVFTERTRMEIRFSSTCVLLVETLNHKGDVLLLFPPGDL